MRASIVGTAVIISLVAMCNAAAQAPAPEPAPGRDTLAAARAGVADTSPFRILDLSTPNAYRSASGMPGPSYWQQRADYTIKASLDTASQTIEGSETIRYTNNSPDTLRFLWLQLDMNAGSKQSRFTVLDSLFVREAPGIVLGATIEHVAALRTGPGGKALSTPLSWWVNSTMMRVDLDRPLPPKTALSLFIGWHHQEPTQGGRTGRQQYPEGWLYQIAQWYPRLAVYDDVRGWNTDQYRGPSEFYLEYGNFDVTLSVPAGYTVAATGTLQNAAQVYPELIRQRLRAAAHADTIVHIISAAELGMPALLPRRTGPTRTWHYTATNVRDFAWAAAPNFIWDATSWDGILMQALYPPDRADVWKTAADMNRHAIMVHSRWLHYPWPTAISVAGPVGGMEYPMITFDDAENEKELYYTLAHELGHQWFPMTVGSDERLYPWMDEGFNTFIDWYTFRSRYPTDTVRIQSLEFGSMRAYQGFLSGYIGQETPIMETQDRSPNGLMSGWNAYGKPAVALHFLREEVVDSNAFDAAFREYVRRWAFKHPQPADFFRTMNNALGEDLSWFWRAWFIEDDHLDQAVDSVVQRDSAGLA
ncbi:MAG TPA: M1 family metallopeptidase, partial [Gemmatimonadales bacterium]|nr:M1 family metallopeptidase [Gemmatimonadales bacterium]